MESEKAGWVGQGWVESEKGGWDKAGWGGKSLNKVGQGLDGVVQDGGWWDKARVGCDKAGVGWTRHGWVGQGRVEFSSDKRFSTSGKLILIIMKNILIL